MASADGASLHNMTAYDQARRDFTWDVAADYKLSGS
jgi:hypothetical protein